MVITLTPAAPSMLIITVPIDARTACSLSHELDGLSTPRTWAYSLLVQALHAVGGYIAVIMLVPGPSGEPAAQVHVGLPHRCDDQPIEVSTALGLLVHTTLPVLVAGSLTQIESMQRQSTSTAGNLTETDEAPAQTPISAPFRHALDDRRVELPLSLRG